MIDTVLLDLDNTILDFNKAEEMALTKTLERIGITPTPDLLMRYSVINLSQWKLLELGKLTVDEVKLKRFELFFQEFGIAASPKDAAHTYEYLLREGCFFMDGAEEMLCALKMSYRLYLVTNGTAHVQHSRIKKADLSRYFEKIFISGEIGYNKPDIRFFEACFSQIPGFEKSKTIIIGDSLSSDIKGGINAGIRTFWYNPDHIRHDKTVTPDYEVSDLRKIPDLLKQIQDNA